MAGRLGPHARRDHPDREATKDLTIAAWRFSFAPTASGNLTATASVPGIEGGSDTVQIISTSEAPITVSYDMTEYTFKEDAADAAVYVVATLNVAYPRAPSRDVEAAFSSRGDTAESLEDYSEISEIVNSVKANTVVTSPPTRSWPASPSQASPS